MQNSGKNTKAGNAAAPEIPESVDSVVHKYTPPGPVVEEFGGYKGPEPTRYGDWEKKGRCIDF